MIKASAVSLLLCGLACAIGCQAEDGAPASAGNAGAAGGGSAGAPPGVAGSPSAGATTVGGSTSVAGSQAVAGAGGASAGASPGGQGGVSSAGAGGGSGVGGSGVPLPLEECVSQPSIDRLTQWTASGEGLTVPATGSILVKDGADYVGKVQFVGAEWHVIPVLIANKFDVTADLSKAASITLTYSATSELHVQLRSKSHWSGGDQYATTIPSTAGKEETHVLSFAEAGWKSLFGAPVLSYADTLKEAMGLVFVGNSENTVVFYGLRIDGYTPSCQ